MRVSAEATDERIQKLLFSEPAGEDSTTDQGHHPRMRNHGVASSLGSLTAISCNDFTPTFRLNAASVARFKERQ
jgi:hypothetical protein